MTRTPLLCMMMVALACVRAACAQGYPEKPLRVIVPFAPGGSTDIVARIVAQHLSERIKQPVVIENRGGAGGNIGSSVVARSAPDGYTLVLGTVGTLAINPSLYASLPYDPATDLTPVAYLGSTANVLVVHSSLPARSVAHLVALATQRPGELNYASAGAGGSVHLAAELFRSMAKVRITHVPYKGSGPALIDLLAGHTQLMFSTIPPALPHVKSARLRALGVTSLQRAALIPAVPTISESGMPGYEVTQWWGLLGPARLAPEIVRRLNAEVNMVVQQREVRERFAGEGAEAAPNTPEWFGEHMRKELTRWAAVVRASGASAQ